MKTVLDAAWMINTALKYCGLAVALGGVAVFGWYFVRANARAARDDMNEDAPVAWGVALERSGACKYLLSAFCFRWQPFFWALSLTGRL